jgi:hypothetical protein
MAKSKSHMHVSIDADSARAGTKLITPSVVSRGDELIENENQTKQTHLIKFLLAYFYPSIDHMFLLDLYHLFRRSIAPGLIAPNKTNTPQN